MSKLDDKIDEILSNGDLNNPVGLIAAIVKESKKQSLNIPREQKERINRLVGNTVSGTIIPIIMENVETNFNTQDMTELIDVFYWMSMIVYKMGLREGKSNDHKSKR